MTFNIFINEKTALHLAIEKKNIEIVKLLLQNGNINVNIITILNNIFQSNFKTNNLIIRMFKNIIKLMQLYKSTFK